MQERWQRVRELLEEALDLPLSERLTFIQGQSADQSVQDDVVRLLQDLEVTSRFLESRPALVASALLDRIDAPKLERGDVLSGRFQIRRLLGRGGMGEVYEADDLQGGARIALKVIRGPACPETTIANLRAELILGRAVTHCNVCRSFDLHHHTGSPAPTEDILFLTMELLEGQTLSHRLQQSGPLPPHAVIDLARQLSAGLAAAHDAGVVHGDLKTSNIMLVPDSHLFRAVIMDFGIAARTEAPGLPAGHGTLAYMAPEQVHGPATRASDIYSLGVLVYEALTGQRPPGDESRKSMALRVSSLPRWFQTILLRCLEANPASRFESGRVLANALAGPSPSNRRVAAGAIAAILLFTTLTGLVLVSRRGRPGLPYRRAVAVYGFQNTSEEPRAAYLSLLFALALDADLSQAEQVRVIPAADVARSKSELQLENVASLSPIDLARIRSDLGADLIVAGSYVSGHAPGALQLQIAIQDAPSGRTLAHITDAGDESNLPALFAHAGKLVRNELGLARIPDGVTDAVRAALPGSLTGMRLYAEGLQQLRSFNPRQAEEILAKAVAADPEYPQAHAALSQAWNELGYGAQAKEEAARAFELRSRLQPEQRLLIEGQYYEVMRAGDRAVAAYQELLRLSPGNPDYLLLLAAAQRGPEALRTIDMLRKLPSPVSRDPRIDLAEAEGAGKANDFQREREFAHRAADGAARVGALLLVARAGISEGAASWIMGRPQEAGAAYAKAKRIYESMGDRNGAGWATRGLALVAQFQGNFEAARDLYTQAISTFRAIGSQQHAARAMNGLALLASTQGQLTEALHDYRQALDICREVKDPSCVGTELNNLGYVLFRKGEFGDARRDLDAARAAFAANQDEFGKTFVLASLGDLLEAQGKLDEAEESLRESLNLSRELKDRNNEATTEVALSAILRDRGRLKEAADLCQRAIEEQVKLGQRDSAAKSRIFLARIALAENRPAKAKAELQNALPDLNRSHRGDEIGVAEALLAETLAITGHPPESRQMSEQVIQYLAKTENRLARITALLSIGRASKALGDDERAKELFAIARTEALERGFRTLGREAEEASVGMGR